ncbi:phosphatidylethanolamine-binding protein [Podospora australis]|uniref:Phosphatidylethanolamine-binding protein n=1 Tax=Podospora australis TaxID=1536484 RepID=A0AAN7AJN7_9PEZI|nr:phosphatidylethanolamine-binding protein [Podospora australis]
MLFSTSSLLATAAFSLGSLVSAQETSWTPAGFSPAVAAKLEVIYGTKASTTPGTSYTKAETARQPTIGTSDAPLNGTYMWLLIDLDVPANFQNPSAGGRRTNLHALITGFKSSGQTVNGVYTLTSTSTGPITYVGPSPPAENPPYPHKYVSLLYETPGGFTVTRAQVGQTFGFNLTTFLSTVKITEAPVRANYLTVTG